MPIAAAPSNLRHAMSTFFMNLTLRLSAGKLLIWINLPAFGSCLLNVSYGNSRDQDPGEFRSPDTPAPAGGRS